MSIDTTQAREIAAKLEELDKEIHKTQGTIGEALGLMGIMVGQGEYIESLNFIENIKFLIASTHNLSVDRNALMSSFGKTVEEQTGISESVEEFVKQYKLDKEFQDTDEGTKH